jgi:hypothetical protein
METPITDDQKMQTILDELALSPYRLTQELELSSSALYHILSGKNKLSKNVIDKICTVYPEVNKRFLMKGIGEPLIEKKPLEYNEYLVVKKADLDDIKNDIKNLYELIKKLNK